MTETGKEGGGKEGRKLKSWRRYQRIRPENND